MSDARILDRGYRPYDGPRHGPAASMRSLSKHTAQRVMGLRRPAGTKILPFMCAFIAYVPALVFIGIAALIPDQDTIRDQILPSYGEYYGFVTSALVVFTAFVAPEALCPDRRTGLLGLYLSAPLNRVTYLLSKAGTVLALLLVATLGPPLLMLIAFVLQGTGPDGIDGFFSVLWRVLLSGLVVGALYTAVSLGVSSLTDRKAFAAAGALLVIILSGVVTGILVEGVGAPDWIFALNLFGAPFEFVLRIYGERSESEVARNVSTYVYVLATLFWIALGTCVTAWRYSRLRITR
jgi:ABC-2 type transport system permease protein